ncbi:MAG: hypothetical protein LBN23_08225 [Paludibacter sp.]|jgi:hypothetical protein|nr:hypothetical protein [Paludibacter sp.]
MKTTKTLLLSVCLSVFAWQMQAQTLETVFSGTSLPTAQGWNELRFDNSMPWEEAAQNLLVAPQELTAVATATLKLKANAVNDNEGFPLWSQLGYYYPNVGFSAAVGYTVSFRAKISNSANGAFSFSAVGGGKGFRIEFDGNKLLEHGNVVDTARVLTTASPADAFHDYHAAVLKNKVVIWRDGVLLGELPLQTFKLDNIIDDGGFENGQSAEAHGWWNDPNIMGTTTVTTNPNYVHTGKYGLFVDKGSHKNNFIPVKPGAYYDMSAWGKTISYPTWDPESNRSWRDLIGRYEPAGDDRTAYFIGDHLNFNWKYYEKTNMEGGAHFSRFSPESPANSNGNLNQMAYDDILFSERLTPSRIPVGTVNLFPNGDFENPDFHYFPEGDPRNDTVMVNPNNFRQSANAYYGGKENSDETWYSPPYNAEHNAAPFWHPFWGARVRVQYDRQTANDEAGNHWARGKYSLRYFTVWGNQFMVPYGTDFSSGQNEDRGSNCPLKSVPIELEVGKKHTFLFSYHFARWGGDRLILVVKNGNTELFRRTVNSDNYNNWNDIVLEFTTDATNHALQVLTENDGNTPGVFYLDDLFLFQGELLPEADGSHIFFGKNTSVKGAEADIEYVKMSNAGAFDPNGNPITEPWSPGIAPLTTAWGEVITAEYVEQNAILNEYPRPQLKREGWTNLNGIWNWNRKPTKTGFGTYNADDSYTKEILVPFPVESALSGIMETDFANQNKTYGYKRNVTIAKPTDNKRIILHFGAIDWESYVFVNGQEVAHHKGGYDPFSADITDKLNASGAQEIVVQVYDPTKGGQPSGKQYPNPQGADYQPATGIWQTVWTETVNPVYITNIDFTPDVDNNAIKVKISASDVATTATVKIFDGASQVANQDIAVGAETAIAISNPKLWSPDSPFLYNVTVELKKNGTATDNVASYFGMRKIEVKMLRNKPFVYLNGEPQFTYATLDHGYYPDGIYTPASYDVIRHDLKKLKELTNLC